MIFRVTHTDPQHHRRKAQVTACNVNDCIAQIEAELGDHIGLSVIRMAAQPVLRVVARLNVSAGESLRGMQCGF